MLSSRHFYHRTTRKLVVAFGTMFNNLKLYRYTKDGETEIERVTVPLTYANKEKYMRYYWNNLNERRKKALERYYKKKKDKNETLFNDKNT